VVQADADLQDAVVQRPVGRAGGAPQEFERLVLLEELARVELLDAATELARRRLVATRADGLVDRAAGDAFRWPRGLAVAAIWWRARTR
jgi:hypothetical protein